MHPFSLPTDRRGYEQKSAHFTVLAVAVALVVSQMEDWHAALSVLLSEGLT